MMRFSTIRKVYATSTSCQPAYIDCLYMIMKEWFDLLPADLECLERTQPPWAQLSALKHPWYHYCSDYPIESYRLLSLGKLVYKARYLPFFNGR